MPNLDAGTLNRPRVWVMQATKDGVGNYLFPLTWKSWVECRRLIAKSDVCLPGGMGRAEFGLLRSTVVDDVHANTFVWPDTTVPIVPGCWICVSNGDTLSGNAPRPQDVKWFGFIDEVSGLQLQGTTEMEGKVTALEIGHMFDRIIPHGWAQESPSTIGYPSALGSPPPANLAGRFDGDIIGNAVAATDGNGRSIYLFQGKPESCGNAASQYFTRWRLLRHMLYLCAPGAFGNAVWSTLCADASDAVDPSDTTKIAGYLNDTAIPESFTVAGVTFKGMLDTLIPRNQSLGWYPAVTSNGTTFSIQIYIYLINDSANYRMPYFGNGGAYTSLSIDATVDPVVRLERRTSSDDMPDEILVEGSNIVLGFSASHKDGNHTTGWAATQQTDYKTAAKGVTGYSALTTDQKRDRNRALRQSQALHDVLTRYRITVEDQGGGSATTGIFFCENSGLGTGAKNPVFQNVVYDKDAHVTRFGYSLGSDGTASPSSITRLPYIPTATLTRTLPWIEGIIATSGADSRPIFSRPWPTFLKPRVFYYDETQPVGLQWTDLLAHGGQKRPTPHLDIDDRGPALRIVYDKPERLGSGIISTTADDVTDGLYDIELDPPVAGLNFFDWTKLVVTVGMASDQRVSARRLRPGIRSDADIRRTITVRDEKLQCWIMLKGSIIGLKSDGTPDRVTATRSDSVHYVTRSDFGKAERMADRLAAWGFRRRNAVTLTLMRPDNAPSWAYIGAPIGTITERAADFNTGNAAVSITSSTVVERVERVWGSAPRLIVETNMPAQPESGGGTAPTSGGPVSMTLGGTIPQAVQATQTQAIVQQANSQRVPLIVGTAGAPDPGLVQVTVASSINNKALAYSSLRGLYFDTSATPLTPASPLAAAYNPLAPVPITDKGIAYATVTLTGAPCLLVNRPINDALGNIVSLPVLSGDFQAGTSFFAFRQVQVPAPGGTYVSAYETYWS